METFPKVSLRFRIVITVPAKYWPFLKTHARFEKLTRELSMLCAFPKSNARFPEVVCVCENARCNGFSSVRFGKRVRVCQK